MPQVSEMIERTSIKYSNLIRKISAPLQQHFGIHYFCYQHVSEEGHWFTFGNQPEWFLYSAENKFYQFNPSLVCSNRYIDSAYLIRSHQHDLFQRTLIVHAVEKFKIDHCLMLTKPSLGGCEYYFFAAPPDHNNIMNIYLSQFSRLNEDYVFYVREQVKHIREQLITASVDLKEINTERYYSTDYLFNTSHKLSSGLSFTNEIKKYPLLTERENQCLTLYRQGFTAKQTAKLLSLSFRTIEDYFEIIKFKHGVQSKRELLFVP